MKYWGLFASAIMLLTACSSSSAQSPRQPAPADVVATVGSTPVTLAEVDEKALQQPVSNFGSAKLSQALYEARRAALDDIVATKLLEAEAKAQNLEPSALIEKEITAKVPAVSDADVSAWYQTNQARLQGAPLEQVRAPIRNYLTQERMQTVRQGYLDTLKAKTSIRVALDPPRQTVAAGNSPSRGPANAPIEMIEFSDFQCPFCQRANPTVQQVMSTYGDRVRLVYRHYPLPNHPNAEPAAEAASCAAEQGKFWPYYDKLFANQSRLQDADLKQHASDLGLDTGKFNACVDTHKFKSLVDADLRAGVDAGVNGTPAFFINGRMLSGAQPFSEFKRIIDEELELKRSR
jgi:protein-disulfide isomerase